MNSIQNKIRSIEDTKNAIQWTGKKRLNTITGCSKCSPGCRNCYALELSEKFKKLYEKGDTRYSKYKNGDEITIHTSVLDQIKWWRDPEIVFVNSMSDLFHEEVSDRHIKQVFRVMNRHPQHQFQLLTKRTERLVQISPQLKWTSNIWIGASVEDRRYVYRIDDLRRIPSRIRFISAEPLIGPLPSLNLNGISWCIIGGESPNPKARKCELEWIEEIVKQCDAQGCSPFVKQLGKHLGHGLNMKGKNAYHGDDWSKFPSHLKRREFPIDINRYMHCFK